MDQIQTRKTSIIFQRVWKASTLLILSVVLLRLLISYQTIPSDSIVTAVSISFLQALVVLGIGRILLWKLPQRKRWMWVRVFFAPYPSASLGFLLSCISIYLVFIASLPIAYKSVEILSSIGLSYIIGATLPVILFGCFPFKMEDSSIVYKISSERYDAFLGTLIASSLLGTALIGASNIEGSNWGGVLIPLYFSLATLLLTYVGALITEYKKKHTTFWFLGVSILAALTLIVAASSITSYSLPSLIFISGKEITSYQIFFVIQIGVLAGWVAGNMVKLYYYLAKITLNYLLKNPIRNVVLGVLIRALLNSSLGLAPAAVALIAIFSSYYIAGFYGASLSILGIVSNVGVSLAIGNNPLSKKHLETLSFSHRRKLELLLPSYSSLSKMFLKGLKIS